jgi:hypothetical protein
MTNPQNSSWSGSIYPVVEMLVGWCGELAYVVARLQIGVFQEANELKYWANKAATQRGAVYGTVGALSALVEEFVILLAFRKACIHTRATGLSPAAA